MATASITAPRCTVCAHPERAIIENTLAHGASQRATADRFDLGKDAVSRHWSDHVSEAWKAAVKMGPWGSRDELEKRCLDQSSSVLDNLKALYASCHAFLVANSEAGSTPQFLAVVARMQSLQRDIAKITGEILPHVSTAGMNVTMNFNSTTYLMGLAEDFARAFADMPDALDRARQIFQSRATAALPSPEMMEEIYRAA